MRNIYAKEHRYSPGVDMSPLKHYVCLVRYMNSNQDIGYLLLNLGQGRKTEYKLEYSKFSTVQSLLKGNSISIHNCVFTADCRVVPIDKSGIEVINVSNSGQFWGLGSALKYYTVPENILALINVSKKFSELYSDYTRVVQSRGIQAHSYDSVLYLCDSIDPLGSHYDEDSSQLELGKRIYPDVDYLDFNGTFTRQINAELCLFDIAMYVLELNLSVIAILIKNGKTMQDQYNVLEWRIQVNETTVKFFMCFHFQSDLQLTKYNLANFELPLYSLYKYKDERIKTMLNLMTDSALLYRYGIRR